MLKLFSSQGTLYPPQREGYGRIYHPDEDVIAWAKKRYENQEIKRMTDIITFYCPYPRRQGKYYYRKTDPATGVTVTTARAHLTRVHIQNAPGEVFYQMALSCTNVDDGASLYELIRVGNIRPEICFDNPELPPPIRHLKDLVREAWRIVKRDYEIPYRRMIFWRRMSDTMADPAEKE